MKMCGLTNYEDAAKAVALGANYIGFIFAESPRRVNAEIVADVLNKLKENNIRDKVKAVGVFVNEEKENIEKVIKQTGIDIVQCMVMKSRQMQIDILFPGTRFFVLPLKKMLISKFSRKVIYGNAIDY